jgi:hypothetical protein
MRHFERAKGRGNGLNLALGGVDTCLIDKAMAATRDYRQTTGTGVCSPVCRNESDLHLRELRLSCRKLRLDWNFQSQPVRKIGGVKAATMRQASHHRLMRNCGFP